MYRLVDSFKDVELTQAIALDLETNGLFPEEGADVILWSITNSKKQTFLIDQRTQTKTAARNFITRINKSCKRVVIQNAKFENKMFYWHYKKMIHPNITFDTMIAYQLLNAGLRKSSGLSAIERAYGIQRKLKQDKQDMQLSFVGHTGPFMDIQLKYAAEDTIYMLGLAKRMYLQLKKLDMLYAMKLEMQVLPILTKMMLRGMRFDKKKHMANVVLWKQKAYDAECAMDDLLRKHTDRDLKPRLRGISSYDRAPVVKQAVTSLDLFGNNSAVPKPTTAEGKKHYRKKKMKLMVEINYGSSHQLKHLFAELGLEIPRDMYDKESFDKSAVSQWKALNPGHWMCDFLDHLLVLKQMTKLCGTYGEKFLVRLSSDGRMRTSYAQSYTHTGRLSSSALLSKQRGADRDLGANLSNIPPKVRPSFVPDEGHIFIDSDHSGQENRIAVSYANEKSLMKMIINDEDMHSKNASVMFGAIFGGRIIVENKKEPIEVYSTYSKTSYTYNKKDLRTYSKSATFALAYGAGAKKLASYYKPYLLKFHPANKHVEVAKKIKEGMRKTYPNYYGFLEHQPKVKQNQGYIISNTITNRRRWFEGNEYAECMNYIPQSVGGDCMKYAMVSIEAYLAKFNKKHGRVVAYQLLSIYDQVVVSCEKEYAKEVGEAVRRFMSDALTMFLKNGMPGDADCNYTEFWTK